MPIHHAAVRIKFGTVDGICSPVAHSCLCVIEIKCLDIYVDPVESGSRDSVLVFHLLFLFTSVTIHTFLIHSKKFCQDRASPRPHYCSKWWYRFASFMTFPEVFH